MSVPAPSGALPSKTVRVTHMSTTVGYYTPKTLNITKPTLVLIPSFACGATAFRPQVTDPALLEFANLLVLEPLGQGITKTTSPAWTDWDSARCFIQATDALGVKKAVVLGHGVGGYIAARMAIYAPDKVIGLIIVGSSLGSATQVASAGGHDVSASMLGLIKLTAAPNPDFAIPADDAKPLVLSNLGPDPSPADAQLWSGLALAGYKGDAGRARLRQCATNWLARDSLHLRLADVTCPVMYVLGSEDKVTTQDAVREDAELFGKPGEVQVEMVQGGFHAPLWTHAEEANKLLLGFMAKNNGKGKAQAMREAVGMVDI